MKKLNTFIVRALSADEMKEYDEDCLVQKADAVTPSTGKRSPLIAAGARTHR
jgi:hypothetical protein